MYKIPKYYRSQIKGVETVEGEPIEWKVERILDNKEPIVDGAPPLFTEKKDGVGPGYNIRTDRWEIAAEAMDNIIATSQAKREGAAKKREKEAVVIEMDTTGDSVAKSTNGTD